MSATDSHIGDYVGAPVESRSFSMAPDSSSPEEHHRHRHRHRRRTSHGKRKVAVRYVLLALIYIGAIVIGFLVWFKLT
jgi:hypothetical protein